MVAKGDVESTTTYNIESHGVDSEQYFQGASTIFTPFTDVVTGMGESEAEAYMDAVDQLAYEHGDAIVGSLKLPKFWGDDEHDVCEGCRNNGDVEDCELECESHYYVSIYFNANKNSNRQSFSNQVTFQSAGEYPN